MQRPNVDVQVMSLDATPHPGTSGLTTRLYNEDVEPYRDAFQRLQAAALPFEVSTQRITELKEGHR
ncbi:hypothetical protein ACWGR4_44870 [Embleya sp. NPDC055664]